MYAFVRVVDADVSVHIHVHITLPTVMVMIEPGVVIKYPVSLSRLR